jgi:CheY-like chemotaxis protein
MERDLISLAGSARHLSRNPLGIIALFIVLIYALASLVGGFSDKLTPAERLPVVWFLILFPVLVLIVFAWLVSRHHAKLYSPADYREDSAFIEASIEQVRVAAAVSAATARRLSSDDEPDEESASQTLIAAGRVAQLITPSLLRAASARRVLWVDDHHANNAYERDAIEALGLQLTLVESTDEAIALLQDERFDVVISDMMRPADPRAGVTLLDRLRRRGVTTPYIIYSVPVTPDQEAEVWRRSGMGVASKPDDLLLMVLGSISAQVEAA